ncbi:MAG: translation initiation factor IF-3 [Spirochaetales bacterium]|nr:translation initiation factor IF-3 [Spirochaetales bacterium]
MAKQNKDNRINENIRAKSVRLIDENGEQAGVVSLEDALQRAKTADLDLVEVSPGANPPVCKLLDYGKYRFELEKKQRESKKKQKQVKQKEIRMQPKIEEHDLAFKVKHIREFLEDGSKVKVTVRFRGRELAHTELGKGVLDEVLEKLEDSYILDSPPKMEGRFMNMQLSPSGKKAKKG